MDNQTDIVESQPVPMGRRAIRWLATSFAILVLAIALLVGLFRLIVPAVPQYRGEVEEWASSILRAPVEIADMDLQWRGLRPEVVLGNVRFVTADARTSLAVRELRIGLSFRSLARAGRLAPARIILNEPDLTWILSNDPAGEAPVAAWIDILAREDRRGELVVNNGRLTIHADDGRKFPFQRVNGRAASDGHNHELQLTVQAPGLLGRTLTVDGKARGRPGTDGWAASAFVDAQQVDTAALQALVGTARLHDGWMDLAIQLDIIANELRSVNVDMGISDVAWTGGTDSRRRTIDHAAAEFTWKRRQNGWTAGFNRFVVERNEETTDNGRLSVEYLEPASPGDTALWRARGGRFWLQDIALLWVLSMQHDETVEILAQLEPRGFVSDLDTALRQGPGQPLRWAVEAAVQDLSWLAMPDRNIPGVAGLDARVDGDGQDGTMQLSGEVEIDMPWLFRKALPGIRLESGFAWIRDEDGTRLRLPRLEAGNDDFDTLRASGEVFLPSGGDPASYELDGEFSGVDMARGHAYLPAKVMLPGLLRWLERDPVLEGTANNGRFELRGPADRHLLIEYDTDELHLDFADRWPRLRGVSSRVRFRDHVFEADVEHGWIVGAEILAATVRIPDMTAQSRAIHIDSRLGNELDALKTAYLVTPPGGRMGEWFEHGVAAGGGLLDLEIIVPLRRGTRPQFSGVLEFDDASYTPGGISYGLTGVNGQLRINGNDVTAKAIDARLFGRPITVDIEGASETDTAVIVLQGALTRASLEEFNIEPGEGVFSGESTWRAWVNMPRAGDAPTAVRFHSNLTGIALDLPAPLGKQAEDTWDMNIHSSLHPEERILRVDIPGRLHAETALRPGEAGWRPRSASVHLGIGQPRMLPDRGMVLSGWLARWELGTGAASAALVGDLELDEIDLQLGELEAFGRSLGNAQVQAQRNASGWYMQLDGERVAGIVELPDTPTETNPVRLDLEHLHLERALLQDRENPPSDPHAVPPAGFHVRNFSSGEVSLGEINGMLRPVADGIALDTFLATSPAHRISLEGSWLTDGMHHSTTIRGTLDSTNVENTLESLGYTALLEAAAGHLEGEVSWPDTPYGTILESLDGNLQVRIENGVLHEVEPGAGRMFGLLSIQALPRRLALDFSDVFRRGMSFDSIRGSFRIDRGQAFTEDLELVGPAARIQVSGRTGLDTRDYDQIVEVTGSLASSLTLAGALAGGPAVGAVLLIASELLKAPLQEMASVRYRLQGSWENPEIERLSDSRRD